ncbi:MAG: HAD family hydrolase [Deltaproteobacteria bacterium]|nr:HAD family hydrolase [Deltaproteobacteria bacterium]
MMISKKYSAFFFDFDGVLADSVEVKTRAFAKLFESHGQEIQALVVDHHRKNGGMTRVDKFYHYYREFLDKPLGLAELQRLCNDFSRLVVDEVVSAPEIPGAENFLKKWHNKAKCFVVSATPDEEISQIVRRRRLEIYFREILGSFRSKQENVRFLLEKYGFNPEKCFFFGDAESDYRAAMDCNVNFIGIVLGPDAPLLQVAPEVKWVRNFVELII